MIFTKEPKKIRVAPEAGRIDSAEERVDAASVSVRASVPAGRKAYGRLLASTILRRLSHSRAACSMDMYKMNCRSREIAHILTRGLEAAVGG